MTLSVTKKQNWKVLCNLVVNLYVRFFDVMTRGISVNPQIEERRFIPHREVFFMIFLSERIRLSCLIRHLGSAILDPPSQDNLLI